MTGLTPFEPDHLVVLGGLAVGVAMLLLTRPHLRRREDRRLRWSVAVLLAANEVVAFLVAWRHGALRVPLQLCELAEYLMCWALISLRPSVCRLAYFWGLCGSLQAALTPDLPRGFPDYWWIKFFISHAGVILSAVYLAVSGRVAPTGRSVWAAWGLANLYAAGAGLVNWAFGANYGYLAHKPLHPSLLDVAGPWPYYLLVMELVALASFGLAYAPFLVARRGGGSALVTGPLR